MHQPEPLWPVARAVKLSPLNLTLQLQREPQPLSPCVHESADGRGPCTYGARAPFHLLPIPPYPSQPKVMPQPLVPPVKALCRSAACPSYHTRPQCLPSKPTPPRTLPSQPLEPVVQILCSSGPGGRLRCLLPARLARPGRPQGGCDHPRGQHGLGGQPRGPWRGLGGAPCRRLQGRGAAAQHRARRQERPRSAVNHEAEAWRTCFACY